MAIVRTIPNTTTGSEAVFAFGLVSPNGYGLQIQRSGSSWRAYHQSAGDKLVTTTTAAVAGMEATLAVGWDGSNVRMWVNANLEGTTAASTLGRNWQIASVGNDESDAANYYDGSVSECVLYRDYRPEILKRWWLHRLGMYQHRRRRVYSIPAAVAADFPFRKYFQGSGSL